MTNEEINEKIMTLKGSVKSYHTQRSGLAETRKTGILHTGLRH